MAEEQEEQKQEKKSNSIVLIFIIGVIAFLIIIGAVLFFVLSGSEDESTETTVSNADSKVSVEQQSEQQTNSIRRNSSVDVGFMFELDKFIVNLLSENGRRYLKIQISLELEDEDQSEEITKKIPIIRDIIIRIASSRTLEDISSEKGKDKFKDQVLQEINQRMKDGRINNIYFTDFVIQ